MNNKASAKRVLAHYIETSFRAGDLNWDRDNVSEVHEIIDSVVAAAVAEATTPLLKRLEELEAQLKEIKPVLENVYFR